ncbi:right-handed parallel beta-helix repeat-containing protein [Massilia sp. R2A-15]|uniref:right-handed parallel beta-helix repeat-containing protein n=1 Tax=Massilia sp. R2A-15 TaxID=3064278 RepID=UPI002736640E|nr:right-handed parallel beta-helix repeat-containing protein [Massilia sp. R2A-15]WLI90654.1 right-handed parallel beta-helix repeat-containing protein [Massilia sp. R2A-15]
MSVSETQVKFRRFPTTASCGAALLAICGAGLLAVRGAGMPQPALGAEAPNYHLYVSPTGSDSNPGSAALPFRTIQQAARVAMQSTTVHVAPGTYRGNVTTSTSGTATARIRFVSDTRWGATIIGSGTEATWTNRGNYVDIVGFDISGSGRHGILNWASNTRMSGNHVHHLSLSGGCTGDGGAGIVNANYSGSNGDIIGNVVHDIGMPGQCNTVHGIYSSNLGGVIANNIVYRASSYGIHLWHAVRNVVIANNTVFANGSAVMGGGIVIGNGDAPGGVVLDYATVINNIVYQNPGASIREFCYAQEKCIGEHNVIANNLVHGNGSGISLKVGSDSATVLTDPQFVDFKADGTGDYHLKSTSPAANQGRLALAPAYDMDNAARPRGAAVDIGAYEDF